MQQAPYKCSHIAFLSVTGVGGASDSTIRRLNEQWRRSTLRTLPFDFQPIPDRSHNLHVVARRSEPVVQRRSLSPRRAQASKQAASRFPVQTWLHIPRFLSRVWDSISRFGGRSFKPDNSKRPDSYVHNQSGNNEWIERNLHFRLQFTSIQLSLQLQSSYRSGHSERLGKRHRTDRDRSRFDFGTESRPGSQGIASHTVRCPGHFHVSARIRPQTFQEALDCDRFLKCLRRYKLRRCRRWQGGSPTPSSNNKNTPQERTPLSSPRRPTVFLTKSHLP